MFTFLYYVIPAVMILLCLIGIFILYDRQVNHLRKLRFTVPLSLILLTISASISTWTDLSPLPFHRQHLYHQEVNRKYQEAENALQSLVDDGFLKIEPEVREKVNRRDFLKARQKIQAVPDKERQKDLIRQYDEYLIIYETHLGKSILHQISQHHLSVSAYSQLTAQDYENTRQQIQQQIQDPQLRARFMKDIDQSQRSHDLLYQ